MRRVVDRWRRRVSGAAPLACDVAGRPVSRRLQVATARFLAITAYADADSIDAERRTLRRGIRQLFGVSRREARRIVAQAEWQGTAWEEPAAQVRDGFGLEQRMRIMGLAWDLARADGLLCAFERVLAPRVGALAGLQPRQAEAARHYANLRRSDPGQVFWARRPPSTGRMAPWM